MEKSILKMVGGEKYLHYDVNNKVAKEYTTLQERIEQLEKENAELEARIERMKCDMLSLVKDRMNDDIDQNIIERLAEKWEEAEQFLEQE